MLRWRLDRTEGWWQLGRQWAPRSTRSATSTPIGAGCIGGDSVYIGVIQVAWGYVGRVEVYRVWRGIQAVRGLSRGSISLLVALLHSIPGAPVVI